MGTTKQKKIFGNDETRVRILQYPIDWRRSVMNLGYPIFKNENETRKKCGWKEFSPVNKIKTKQKAEVSKRMNLHLITGKQKPV